MAASVNPTYPLYPIACVLSATMLLLVLLTSFIRQSWNLGVAFLCFWLFFENLTSGVNGIIWADNADIRLYVYCDIVTHLQLITHVVKPMATLIITRRLYLITRLRSGEHPDRSAKRRELAIEWTLGLVIPVVVAGPFYYVVQYSRFEVEEGIGCSNASDGSVLAILLIDSWTLIPPLLSIFVYHPRVARILYRQSQEVNHFLRSNSYVSRTNYFRILALASIDILLTLPIGIVSIVLTVSQSGAFPFYFGWADDHSEWEPEGATLADTAAEGTASVAQYYFNPWTSPALAFVIFGLFGLTSEARASYRRIFCTFGGWIGWKPTPRAHRARSPQEDTDIGDREPQNMSLSLESQPSYINHALRAQEQDVESGRVYATTSESESSSDTEIVEGTGRVSSDIVRAEQPSQKRGSSSCCAEVIGAPGAV